MYERMDYSNAAVVSKNRTNQGMGSRVCRARDDDELQLYVSLAPYA